MGDAMIMPRWFLALLVPLTLHLVPAHTRPNSVYSIITTSHGVRLSLILARRTYLRNSLAPTTVTVRNVSRHVIRLTTYPPINGSQGPGVSVVDATGNVVYPPALSKVFRLPNPFPGGVQLRPGKTYKTQSYVILRAAHLGADVVVQDQKAAHTLRTRQLTVRLTPALPLQVDLHISRTSSFADIHRPAGARGRLLYMSAARCAPPETESQVLDWTAVRGTRLVSGCHDLVEWHAIAGWPDRPIATIDYLRP